MKLMFFTVFVIYIYIYRPLLMTFRISPYNKGFMCYTYFICHNSIYLFIRGWIQERIGS